MNVWEYVLNFQKVKNIQSALLNLIKVLSFGWMQDIKNNKKLYITICYSGDRDQNNIYQGIELS